jgi:hypothetical protein
MDYEKKGEISIVKSGEVHLREDATAVSEPEI